MFVTINNKYHVGFLCIYTHLMYAEVVNYSFPQMNSMNEWMKNGQVYLVMIFILSLNFELKKDEGNFDCVNIKIDFKIV